MAYTVSLCLISLSVLVAWHAYEPQDVSSAYRFVLEILPPTSHPPDEVLSGPRRSELKRHWPLFLHLAGVVPAFFLAFPLVLMRKGTFLHRFVGVVFMTLMLVGVGSTYWVKLLRRNDESRGECLVLPFRSFKVLIYL